MYYSRFSLFPLSLFLIFCILLTGCATRDTHNSSCREGILLVAFGTSVPEATAAYKNIEAAYREAFPDSPLEWAFTSQIIRKKLATRGVKNASISEALEALLKEGVSSVRVQSLHIMAGEEFSELARALSHFINKYPDSFQAIYLGRPLLESRQDAVETVTALRRSLKHDCATGEMIVLMAHGQKKGRAGLALEGARAVFQETDPHFLMASVEGERNFEELLNELEKYKIKKIKLTPLMLVAGDHARNDLAGDEDNSWASLLKKQGYQVESNLQGLGEKDGIPGIFIRHSRDGGENLVLKPKKF